MDDLNSLIPEMKPSFVLIILLLESQPLKIPTQLCSLYHKTETEFENRLKKDPLAQKLPETSHSCEPLAYIGSHSTSSDNMLEMLEDNGHMVMAEKKPTIPILKTPEQKKLC